MECSEMQEYSKNKFRFRLFSFQKYMYNVHGEKKLHFAILSFKDWGGGGLKILVDMSAIFLFFLLYIDVVIMLL